VRDTTLDDEKYDVHYKLQHRTGLYYTAKLTFSTIFMSKFGVRVVQVCVL